VAVVVVLLAIQTLLAGVLALTGLGRDMALVAHSHPNWSVARVRGDVLSQVLTLVIPRVALALILLWLAAMLRRGRRWVRLVVTVVLAAGVLVELEGAFSPATALPLRLVAGLMAALEVLTMVTLWLAPRSRAFFAPGRLP
jgi:hypothetical protein